MREIRTYVRCGGRVVELKAGNPLTVGRSDECDLVLDDELASRRHFRVELVGNDVEAVDLGSRNGILVNGLKVEGRQVLHHGDVVTAGKSQVYIARQAHRPRTDSVPDEDVEDELQMRRTSSAVDMTTTGSVFDIFGGSVKRALAEEDFATAEHSGQNLFMAIRSSLVRRRPVPEGTLDDAVDAAFQLAKQTGDAGWIDRVLELHVSLERPMTASVTERLVAAMRELEGSLRSLDDYVKLARGAGDPNADRVATLRR